MRIAEQHPNNKTRKDVRIDLLQQVAVDLWLMSTTSMSVLSW
jgi:hypothetical protein